MPPVFRSSIDINLHINYDHSVMFECQKKYKTVSTHMLLEANKSEDIKDIKVTLR